MRTRLSDSLRNLAEQARHIVPIPAESYDAACMRIANSSAVPRTFAAYCELVLALQSKDWDSAARLFNEIAQPDSPPGALEIWRFADPANDPVSRRYERLFNTDPEQPFAIRAPAEATARACERRIADALQLLARCDPVSFEELGVFLKEIVIAEGAGTPGSLTFDGASSFMLFGAILLNATGHDTVMQTLEALVHESSHNLLFGLCADGALHDNDDDDSRYASPLRLDARPMDGIIHATFVLARMFQIMRRLLDTNQLTDAQAREARRLMTASANHYQSGWNVIREHARLTPLGRDIMQGAHDYMAPHLGRATVDWSATRGGAA